MDVRDFATRLAAHFDGAETASITADTRFHELKGWDSITAIMVINMVEEEYGVMIGGDELRGCTTVDDLYRLVVGKAK